MCIRDRIRIIKQRYDEVSDLIIQPEIIMDQKRYAQLMKEYKDLGGVVERGEEYQALLNNIEEAKEILSDGSDAEMVEMAKTEIDEASNRIPELEDEIKFLLIPKDPEDSKNAVVENLADSLKEISRHGDTIGEAAFKSGKYLFRMADAALNMGFSEKNINDIYNSAVKISDTIKGDSSLSGEEQKTESAAAIQQIAGWEGVNSADKLKAKVKEVAQEIIIWYNKKDAAFSGQDSNAVGTNKPKEK